MYVSGTTLTLNTVPVAAPPEPAVPSTPRVLVHGVATALGTALLALSTTALWHMMRSVMAIGGSCASGGPYVSARPCPDGVGGLVGIALGGLFAGMVLLAIGSMARGGVRVLLWFWPALFLSLGANFLTFGLDPTVGEGPVVSWLVCAALFGLMGAVPLLHLLAPSTLRRRLWDGPFGAGVKTALVLLTLAGAAAGVWLGATVASSLL